MPRTPIDYSKTVIYKIVCNDLTITDCYVGSTTDFTKRKCKHKSVCNNKNDNNYNLKVYTIIRNNGGWDNWTMVEIEKYPCTDSNESTKQERYWYEELKANLNCSVPNRSKQEGQREHYLDNKKEKCDKSLDYYLKHKDKIQLRWKQVFLCECGKTFNCNHKLRHLTTQFHQKYLLTQIEV
jgi:hypothetical protein